MADEIIGQLQGMRPEESIQKVAEEQKEIIALLDSTNVKLKEKTEASQKRFEAALGKMTDSIQKLQSIRGQLVSITTRVNALKKYADAQTAAQTPTQPQTPAE